MSGMEHTGCTGSHSAKMVLDSWSWLLPDPRTGKLGRTSLGRTWKSLYTSRLWHKKRYWSSDIRTDTLGRTSLGRTRQCLYMSRLCHNCHCCSDICTDTVGRTSLWRTRKCLYMSHPSYRRNWYSDICTDTMDRSSLFLFYIVHLQVSRRQQPLT
jgi:hypothetical protein